MNCLFDKNQAEITLIDKQTLKNIMVTELVTFQGLETTTDSQLLSKAESLIIGFWKNQAGFMGAELVKDIEETSWCFIYHNESLEQLKASSVKMRESNEFKEFVSLIVPESIRATFFHPIKQW